MGDTFTAPAKNRAGEDVTLEIPIPEANTAAAWNDAMSTAAQKADVEIPGVTPAPAAAAAAATTETPKKEGDQTTVYKATLTVNGQEMVFEGTDAAKVLEQYTTAVSAAQLAGTPAAAAKEPEQKPAVTAVDMFDIGTRLIGGDATALDDLIVKSGAVGRYLEKEGVSIEALKAATQKTQSDTVFNEMTAGRDAFIAKVKAGESDFPGGQQNEKMMGIMLARVHAEDKAAGKEPKFNVETYERAYALMKAEGLVFPAENKQNTTQQTTTTTDKKTAPSSTITGTSGAGPQTSSPTQSNKPKIELDMTAMNGSQFALAYNAAIDQGYKVGMDLFIKQ